MMERVSTIENLVPSVCDVGVKHIPDRSNSLFLQKKDINSVTVGISHSRKVSSAGYNEQKPTQTVFNIASCTNEAT